MVHKTSLNITKRRVILVILNALISTLLISCVVYLYYLLSTNSTKASNSSNSDIKTFTLDKESSNFMKILSKKYFHEITNNNNMNNNNNNINNDIKNNRNIVIHRNDGLQPDPSNNNDDTIYIDNYSEESYETLENQEIDHPMDSKEPIKKPIYPTTSKSDVDDFDYDNEDDYEYDDNDLVSSGNGKIVVDIKSIVKPTNTQETLKQNRIRAMNEEDENVEDYKVEAVASEDDNMRKPENVYSVSSEILISHVITQNEKQINTDKNQPDSEKTQESTSSDDEVSDDDDEEDFGDDWSGTEADGAESRRSGNVRKSQEKSRQLLLCETAGTGELCRMLFKGSFG